jgi:hypothetical protein
LRLLLIWRYRVSGKNRVTAAIQRIAQLQGPFSSHAPPRKPHKFSSLSSKAQPNNRGENRSYTLVCSPILMQRLWYVCIIMLVGNQHVMLLTVRRSGVMGGDATMHLGRRGLKTYSSMHQKGFTFCSKRELQF